MDEGRKRLHYDEEGSRGLSTKFKLPKIVPPAPRFSKYSENIPGFRETGSLKVRSSRGTDLSVNPSRRSGTSMVDKRFPVISDKADLAKGGEHGSLCKQSEHVVSPKTSPRSQAFRPTKIQLCDPVPKFTKTKVPEVRTARTCVPVNSSTSKYNDSSEPEKIENVVKETSEILEKTYEAKVQENVTMSLVVPVARDLHPGYGGRSGEELDENGFAPERAPLKELAKAHSFDGKACKGGYFVPAKESFNLSRFRDEKIVTNRYKVIETMCLFDKAYEEGLKAKSKGCIKAGEHVSGIATRIVKDKIIWDNNDHIGNIGGIEIGDQFQFKGQLVLIGLHYGYNDGISYIKKGEKLYATSIVDSARYTSKEAVESDTICFSGQGGNPLISQQNRVEDQKLERGNLALKNSMDAKTPVRVIRKLPILKGTKKEMMFVYDGLYTVTNYTQQRGQFGKLIFMFELKRNSNQPRLADCTVSEPRKQNRKNGVCLVDDISQGKENIPIRAFNALDNEKPPHFNYITEMIYPKSTVYLCSPTFKCLPGKNRYSQTDMRYQLEIFKTEYNRWAVRSRNFVAEGNFVCEYVGVLRQSMEVKKGNNIKQYIYAIRNEAVKSRFKKGKGDDEDGYVIDATEYGNVARFINRSHSPNLYAKTVVHYDEEKRRVAHVMLFASKNIPPLRELTLGL